MQDNSSSSDSEEENRKPIFIDNSEKEEEESSDKEEESENTESTDEVAYNDSSNKSNGNEHIDSDFWFPKNSSTPLISSSSFDEELSTEKQMTSREKKSSSTEQLFSKANTNLKNNSNQIKQLINRESEKQNTTKQTSSIRNIDKYHDETSLSMHHLNDFCMQLKQKLKLCLASSDVNKIINEIKESAFFKQYNNRRYNTQDIIGLNILTIMIGITGVIPPAEKTSLICGYHGCTCTFTRGNDRVQHW